MHGKGEWTKSKKQLFSCVNLLWQSVMRLCYVNIYSVQVKNQKHRVVGHI